MEIRKYVCLCTVAPKETKPLMKKENSSSRWIGTWRDWKQRDKRLFKFSHVVIVTLNPDTFSQGMSVFTRPYVRGQGWNGT